MKAEEILKITLPKNETGKIPNACEHGDHPGICERCNVEDESVAKEN
jgi:hypothetical protein